jgi:hypothetical protein
MRRPEYWDWVLDSNNARQDNPDPYAFASSFYGPGVIFSWYMVLLAVLVQHIDDAVHDHRPGGRIRFSAELFAVLCYPAIAAGHLLVRLTEFPQAERSKVLEILLDTVMGVGALHPILGDPSPRPPSVTAFQHAVGIEGPVRVVQNFVVPIIYALLIASLEVPGTCGWPFGRGRWWLRTGWVGWLVFAVYWWCCLVLLALGAVGWNSVYLACYIPFVFAGQLVCVGDIWASFFSGLWVVVFMLLGYVAVRTADIGYFIGICVVIMAVPFAYCSSITWPPLPTVLFTFIVPDTGVSYGELDQVATAVTGVVTLMVALWNATGLQAHKRQLQRWWRATIGHGSGGSVEDLPLESATDGNQTVCEQTM